METVKKLKTFQGNPVTSVRVSSEDSTFKIWYCRTKSLLAKWSVSYTEIVEFNYVELICYMKGKSLLQTKASITKMGKFITN